MKNRFQAFAFKCNLYRYTEARTYEQQRVVLVHGGGLYPSRVSDSLHGPRWLSSNAIYIW